VTKRLVFASVVAYVGQNYRTSIQGGLILALDGIRVCSFACCCGTVCQTDLRNSYRHLVYATITCIRRTSVLGMDALVRVGRANSVRMPSYGPEKME
jgi:hypothetical protein